MKYIVALISVVLFAAEPVYKFSNQLLQQRFTENLSQYRCLVCQNESLLDSQAPLASDLRRQIYLLLLEGKTDSEIRAMLVARFGNFIQLAPPMNQHTILLWMMPILLLLALGFRLVRAR